MDTRRTWQELRYYESKDSLAELARQRLGYELGGEQGDDILACFQLGRDYFHSAIAAPFSIKPVLLYYGVTNLAKGLILLCGGRERRRLANLTASHGLEIVPRDTLEGVACKIGPAGTFVDFIDTFRCDLPFIFPNVYDARLRQAGAGELRGCQLTVKQLAGRFPEVRLLYEKTFGDRQSVVRGRFHWNATNNECQVMFPYGARLADDWYQAFPLNTQWGQSETYGVTSIRFKAPIPKPWGRWISAAEGGGLWPMSVEVEVEPDATLTLSPAGSQFALMFILSMIVRYEPRNWVDVVVRTGRRRVLALIEALMSHVEESFPALVLDVLRRATLMKGFVTNLDGLTPDRLGLMG